MAHEVSAGGVVVRRHQGALEIAVICPRGRKLWALPKGHLNPGELLQGAAAREVNEETGLSVELLAELGEIQYVYQFRKERIQKKVAFFLFKCTGGEIGQIALEMRVEVDEARWLPLAQADGFLAYPGEKDMVAKAIRLLDQNQSWLD